MRYIPLRVHTLFSRGKGAVDPHCFAEFAEKRGLKYICVSDPLSVISWESFYRAASGRELRFIPGTEIRFRASGSALLFPLNVEGYYSVISSLNRRSIFPMSDVGVIYIPGGSAKNSLKALKNISSYIPAGHLFFGLGWHTSRDILEESEKMGVPPVWAQPLKWTGDPEKLRALMSVFGHLPAQETEEDNSVFLYGPLGFNAIAKRWGNRGKTAMRNTFRFTEMVGFDFGSSFSVPPHKLLDDKNGDAGANRELGKMVSLGLSRLHAGKSGEKRAKMELLRVEKMGFAPYFIIASEISSYCRRRGIYFNIRGSGGSSYILYLLGLSKVDPLDHPLLFERFVNSLRDELPDIDIDIDSSRREEVLRWVFKKFDKRVAFLSTHKFFRARSALYETARSFGFNPEESHRMSRDVSFFAPPSELSGMGKGKMRKIYERAALLDGVFRELSLHLGGVIFSHRRVEESYPIETSPSGFPQVVWDKESIERLKIFKLDLLGVRGFDVISPHALNGKVKFDDPVVWDNIRSANTRGCFQLESPLARENLERAKPVNLNELAISVAIIRPGPAKSGMKKRYISKDAPLHPLMKEIFPYTRGTLIFEEQISILLHHISGWSLEFSEKVRREMKKKRGDNFREAFLLSGSERGWTAKELELFWNLASDFSSYAFNHAHSVSYAYSAYISAWMKYHYPVPFFKRLFNSGGGYYPLPVYIDEAKKWGVEILPPDINFSQRGFSEESGKIRTGLLFVKGIGGKLSGRITEVRGSGFESVEDFIGRSRAGNRELSALMAVSAFESVGVNGYSPEEKRKNWEEYLGFIPGSR